MTEAQRIHGFIKGSVAFSLALLLLCCAAPLSVAYAQCASPSGATGSLHYASAENTYYYCNGTSWADSSAFSSSITYSSGLVGYWKLDETSGTIAYDSSGNGYNLTMNGGLSATNDSVAGKIGTAINFDGIDDYATTNTDISTFTDGSAFTLAVWVRPTDNSGSTLNNSGFLPGIFQDAESYIWISNGSYNGNDRIWTGIIDFSAGIHSSATLLFF